MLAIEHFEEAESDMGAVEHALRGTFHKTRWAFQSSILNWRNPDALAFYKTALAHGYLPNNLIDVVTDLDIVYIANPKAACTRIRATLASFLGRDVMSGWSADKNWQVHKRSNSGLKAPRHNIPAFYRLAKSLSTLRFSFVRNPYDRMVSCWVDQYRGKPLMTGRDVYINTYLENRKDVNTNLPVGPTETLSFSQFVEFALATDGIAKPAVAMHWHPQTKILHVPGMDLNFVGKIENFTTDFDRVLDFLHASDEARAKLVEPFHYSKRKPVWDYLTTPLAQRIYSAYEEDFDRFGYPRTLPS